MKRATALLAGSMRYEVPEQDLRIPMSTMPTLPKSRSIIRNVETIQ